MRKRFFGILAALCLCLTLLPAAALAESGSIDQAEFFVTSWGDLRDTLTNSTEAVINAQLTQGITWDEGSIVIPAGKTVTLDLNGWKIDAQEQGTAINYQQQRNKSKRNAGYRTSWWRNRERSRNQRKSWRRHLYCTRWSSDYERRLDCTM